MTAIVVGCMVAAMDDFEQKYRALVERITGYPMTEAAAARILAEIKASYGRERATEADRADGQSGGVGASTGPPTMAGKARVVRNAYKSGTREAHRLLARLLREMEFQRE